MTVTNKFDKADKNTTFKSSFAPVKPKCLTTVTLKNRLGLTNTPINLSNIMAVNAPAGFGSVEGNVEYSKMERFEQQLRQFMTENRWKTRAYFALATGGVSLAIEGADRWLLKKKFSGAVGSVLDRMETSNVPVLKQIGKYRATVATTLGAIGLGDNVGDLNTGMTIEKAVQSDLLKGQFDNPFKGFVGEAQAFEPKAVATEYEAGDPNELTPEEEAWIIEESQKRMEETRAETERIKQETDEGYRRMAEETTEMLQKTSYQE